MRRCVPAVTPMLALVLAYALLAPAVHAQSAWKPTKTIEYVNPAGPGGSVDLMIRITKKFAEDHKMHDVPANAIVRSGANGGIAMDYMAGPNAGNETLLAISHTFLSNKLTGESRHDWRDVTPVGILFKEFHVIAVRTDSRVKDGRDLIARLRAEPGSVSFGFFGSPGNHLHLAAAIPLKAAGVDIKRLTTVPYRSGPEALTAVLGGHLDAALVTAVVAQPHVEAGKLRVLSQSGAQRLSGYLQSVPTWREMGVDVEYATAQGFAGPKAMSREAIAYWEGILGRLAKDEEWLKTLARSHWQSAYMTAAEHRKYYEGEFPRLQAVLQELGLVKQ